MDKSDRAYRSHVKGCEKLQGLLRQAREVHKMHGGLRNRSSAPSATASAARALASHRRKSWLSMSAAYTGEHQCLQLWRASESPYNRPEENPEKDLSLKRKQASSGSSTSDAGKDEMRSEIKRLRKGWEEKDSRLRQLQQCHR
jgi:hypothetical protein